MSATNNFSKVLGEGSFGVVYYGKLYNGQEVAVKRLSTTHQGAKEIFTEVCLYYIYITKTTKFIILTCKYNFSIFLNIN